MFLEVLKLIAGILLALPAILGVLITIELIGIYMDLGRSEAEHFDKVRIRFRAVVAVLLAVIFSVLAGAGAAYLISGSITAMRG